MCNQERAIEQLTAQIAALKALEAIAEIAVDIENKLANGEMIEGCKVDCDLDLECTKCNTIRGKLLNAFNVLEKSKHIRHSDERKVDVND